jgi:oligoribonuclease
MFHMMLVWFDIECTGLNPRSDKILEVACGFASLDKPFVVVDIQHHWVLQHRAPYTGDEFSEPQYDPVVMKMHADNGLWKECAKSGIGVADVEAELLLLVGPRAADPEERPVLAGDSVHFDLGFVRAHMPELAKRLSHRVYDVSAVKLFCRSLGMKKIPKGEEAHRAKGDVLRSIQHARACADFMVGHPHPVYGDMRDYDRWPVPR